MTRHFTECMNLLRCRFDLSEGEIFQLISIGAAHKELTALRDFDAGKEGLYRWIKNAAKNYNIRGMQPRILWFYTFYNLLLFTFLCFLTLFAIFTTRSTTTPTIASNSKTTPKIIKKNW